MECDFQPAGTKNGKRIFRCANTGCTNAVYSEDGKIGPAKCKSKVVGEAIERAKEKYPCPYRGELTSDTVRGCGCHVSKWQKQLYACEIHGECVLLKLAKLPGQINCQGCATRPASVHADQ